MAKLFLVLIFSVKALSFSVNPKKIKYTPFHVYSNYSLFKDQITLRGVRFSRGKVKKNGLRVTMPKAYYEKVKKMAKSVLRVKSNVGDGSAVHVGGNLVMTNLHVLSESLNEKIKYCASIFKTKAFGFKDVSLKCEKIHFCSKKLDFCLLELKDHRKGFSLRNIKAPALLSSFNPPNPKDIELLAIGNTGGYGIHASSGFGMNIHNALKIKFYAGVFKGNSGGGLFNMDGDLVSIVVAQSSKKYSKDSYNIGIQLSAIKLALEKQVNKYIFEQINWMN